jgi:hypothetical protein
VPEVSTLHVLHYGGNDGERVPRATDRPRTPATSHRSFPTVGKIDGEICVAFVHERGATRAPVRSLAEERRERRGIMVNPVESLSIGHDDASEHTVSSWHVGPTR